MTIPRPAATLPFHPGETLDERWRIDAVLPGAMGIVLIVTEPTTGARMAAKTPRALRELDSEQRRRFGVEARTWLTLGRHENVVEAFFFEEIRTGEIVRPFLFLEYVDGPTLDTVLRAERRLAVPVVLDVASGMAWGMSHAHGEGREGPRIVHRDLKPENVFLTLDRVVKVSDFGIARALDRPDEVAETGAGLGTPYYIAPEQLKDGRAAGVESDVYSYGAVLFQLLTGEPPFPAESLSQLVWRVLREAPRAPSSMVSGVPPALDQLVVRCLAKLPGDRPRSFAEILDDISEIREIDALWVPRERNRSCPSCGWLTILPARGCSICGHPTGDSSRYAPAARRRRGATSTLGRTGTGSLAVEGFEVRPRLPRAGDSVRLTLLLGNAGSEPVEHVVVPHMLPDRDAFARATGHRRAFRGTVPPTAAGAPLRVSWTVRALREGRYVIPAPSALYRAGDGSRRRVRGTERDLVVAPNETTPFVGREAEIGVIQSVLDRPAKSAALLLFLGRYGLGKSRLAREARQAAAARGYQVARGRCLARGAEVRGALKDALRQLLGLRAPARSAPEVAAALVDRLGNDVRGEPGLVDFLVAELLARPLPRGESPARMWSRLAVLLGNRKPFLLVIEDVQRDLDVAGIAVHMARRAAREGAQFIALLNGRPTLEQTPPGREFLELLDTVSEPQLSVRRLRLKPLDESATRDFVDATFEPNDFVTSVPWLYQEVTARSGGNPLFLTEILGALRAAQPDGEAHLLTREGRWTAADGLTPEDVAALVPPRAEELVVERLSRMPPATRAFGCAAAVLGDAFEPTLLRAVLEDDTTYDDALAQLEAEGILRETAGRRTMVRFREPLIPEIVARWLALNHPQAFARINARAADHLMSRGVADGRYALRLARHLSGAGRYDDAFRARLAAARRLVDRQSYRQARHVLDEAERLVEERGVRVARGDRTEFLLLRAEARRFSGNYAGALEAYRQLVESPPGRRPNEEVLASVYSKMGKVHEALGELDQALYCYAVGLTLREERGLHADVPMSLVNLAGLHDRRGERRQAEHFLSRAIRSGHAVANHRALGRAHALRARVAARGGKTGAARVDVRSALHFARVANDRRAGADAWNVAGIANSLDGRSVRALRYFVRALHLRQECGDLAAVGASWNNIGTALEALGRRDEASDAYGRAAELYRRIGSRHGLGTTLANLGTLHVDSGRPRRALRELEEARDALRESGDPVVLASALAESARARLALSPPRSAGEEEALALLQEALQLSEDRGDRDADAAVALVWAAYHFGRGDAAAAVTELRRVLPQTGLSPGRRVALLALLAEAEGDADAADAALTLAEAGGSPRTRARALAAAGRVRLAHGDTTQAAGFLRRASGLLLQAGARDPLLLGILRHVALAQEQSDPAAAAAAEARAAELAHELEGRGYPSSRLVRSVT